MAKQIRADKGGKPWCVQPELVEGCSMRYGSGSGGLCHFCGIQAIRSHFGNYKYMDSVTAILIARGCKDFCPTARIEFAMRGEPLMNPLALDIFRIFHEHCPKAQLMVTTNGDTLRGRMAERSNRIFNAGVNFILLDTYYPKERRDALREEALAIKTGINVIDYYTEWAPRGISPYHNQGKKIQNTIVLMDDLSVRDGEHGSRLVKTHAGSNPSKILDHYLVRNCGRPFREMTFTWDGYFALCCDDWKREYLVGNIDQYDMEELWGHPRIEAARARLYSKDRDWGPCQQCDAPSAPRSGLLPTYESPTIRDIRLTERIFEPKEPLWKKS